MRCKLLWFRVIRLKNANFVYKRQVGFFGVVDLGYESASQDRQRGAARAVIGPHSRRFDQLPFHAQIRAWKAQFIFSGATVPGHSAGTTDTGSFFQSVGGITPQAAVVEDFCSTA